MITPLYASLLAFLFVSLSVRTLLLRRKLKIGIGDGSNQTMLRAMRVHSNFSEYAPFTLLLIFMLELSQANIYLVHFLCSILLIGRCSHAYGVSKVNENYFYRVFGMAMTFTSLSISALSCVLYSIKSIST